MSELLAWMGEHPILTVILAYFMFQTPIYIVQAFRGKSCECQRQGTPK